MERLRLLLNNFSDLQKELALLSCELEDEKTDLFNAIVENSTSFIAIFQDEKFVFANSRALILLKCKNTSEILGRNIFELLHPQYHASIRERLIRIKENKHNEAIPVKFTTSSGDYVDIEASSVPFLYKGNQAVLLVGRDIAVEVELKNRLLEEERLRNLLMEMHPDLADFYAPDAIIQFDLSGHIIYVSRSIEALLGLSETAYIGKRVQCLFSNNSKACQSIADAVSQVISTRQSCKIEIRYTTSSGKSRYDLVWLSPLFTENGKVASVIAITRKITSLKQAEQELERNVARLNRAEYIALIGHMEYDVIKNTRYWSEGALNILKAPKDVIEKRADGNYFDRIHPEDVNRIVSEQRRSVEQNVPFDQTYRIVDFEGNPKIIHGLGEVQHDAEGKPVKFLGIVQDVTELYDLNKRLLEEMDKYKMFIDDAPVGVMLFIGEEIQYANKLMIEIAGISNLYELTLLNRMEIVHPEDRNQIVPIIEKLKFDLLPSPQSLKIRIMKKDFVIKTIKVIISNCIIGDRKYTQVIVMDITREVEKEEKVRQLAADALYLGQRNKLLDIIENEIDQILDSKSTYTKNDLQRILSILKGHSKSEQDWDLFKTQINELHPDFFSRLKQEFPFLTQHDIRHCAYIKLNFDTKEIARFFNVKPETIQMSRVRMKKKMKLPEASDLRDFIIKF